MLLIFLLILLIGLAAIIGVTVGMPRKSAVVSVTPTPSIFPSPTPTVTVTVSPTPTNTILEDTFDNPSGTQKLITFPDNVPVVGRWSLPSSATYAPVIPATSDYCRGFPTQLNSYAEVTDTSAYNNTVDTLTFDTTFNFSSAMNTPGMFDYPYLTTLSTPSNTAYISCRMTFDASSLSMYTVFRQYASPGFANTIGTYTFPSPIFDTDTKFRWSITPEGAIQVFVNDILVKSLTATNPVPKNEPTLTRMILEMSQSQLGGGPSLIGPYIKYMKISK